MARVFNFSAGPAALPLPVLERIRDEIVELPGAGASILEISHRSKAFDEVIESAEQGVRDLLGVPDGYHVLFLQGGASLQFSMVPMNLLAQGGSADYLLNGVWSQKALKEAEKVGSARTAGTTEAENFRSNPKELDFDPKAKYVHITTNETIFGVQWQGLPDTNGTPLVADASSDILSRPMDMERYGMIYAGAQKNIGPSGVTLVIVRDDFAQPVKGLGSMLSYAVQAKSKSLFNTPNTFGIYVIGLVCDHLKERGGLEAVARQNASKAKLLYDILDGSEFYRGHAQPEDRSLMNVTYRLPSEELEKQFVAEAKAQGMVELKGHRDVGGIRASIYNAFPVEGVQALANFMREFERAHA